MNEQSLFELHILGEMRAEERVAQAVCQGGWSPNDLTTARRWAESRGFSTLVRPMSLYSEVLGEAVEQRITKDDDPYREACDCYVLSPWPELFFCVMGERSRAATGALRFARRQLGDSRRVASSSDLAVWAYVEDDLLHWSNPPTQAEEWFPRRDFEFRPMHPETSSAYILQFDYGLLQGWERK